MRKRAEKRARNVSPEGRQTHREIAEALKAERWGGAVKTDVIRLTLPAHLIEAVKSEAKRSKRPIGAVLYGLIDPLKVAELP